VRAPRPSYACIQIWSFGKSKSRDETSENPFSSTSMCCEMILCIDSGPAHDLQWCPLPSNDPVCQSHTLYMAPLLIILQWDPRNEYDGPDIKRKLGILAGTFEDGSLSVFVVPDPEDLPWSSDGGGPLYGMHFLSVPL